MQGQLAAQKREVAAAKAVTTTLIDRGWAMLKRGHRLLDWFNRHSRIGNSTESSCVLTRAGLSAAVSRARRDGHLP